MIVLQHIIKAERGALDGTQEPRDLGVKSGSAGDFVAMKAL